MTYRILSLDGGGTWSLLQVVALQRIYGKECRGHEVLRHFDLAVGNSGGSIVLAGLIVDHPLEVIRSFFEDRAKRRSIFTDDRFYWLNKWVKIVPKYQVAAKRRGLMAVLGPLGATPLADLPRLPNWPKGPSGAPLRVTVVGFDYDSLRAEFFRTYATDVQTKASVIPLVDAAHASSTAPVIYFNAPSSCGKYRYWDGAMGAYNNPAMVGVVEALATRSAGRTLEPADLRLLSLGTGTVRLPVERDLEHPSHPWKRASLVTTPGRTRWIRDAVRAASGILDDPPDAATFTAHVVLGGRVDAVGPVVRLSPVIQPAVRDGCWDTPPGLADQEFDRLADLEMDAVADEQVALLETLGAAWVAGTVPNQPILFDSDLGCKLGDPTFAAASTRWQALA